MGLFLLLSNKKGKALAVGVAYIGVLIVLILIEVPQSIILKMEIIIFVIFSNVYILQQCRLHIEGKRDSGKHYYVYVLWFCLRL